MEPITQAEVAQLGRPYWYRPMLGRLLRGEIPQETQNRRGDRWTPLDHQILYKYFGTYRGKANVKGFTCRHIEMVMDTLDVEFSKDFSCQQIREKLKGWNPK
jgi:hypothetical protein